MPSYVKQYGEKRTCTNWLYVLICDNYEDVVVLTNYLGWKHGRPEDFKNWLPFLLDPVRAPRPGNPDDTVRGPREIKPKDTKHVGMFRGLAAHLDEVKRVVCIKDPYAWLLSDLDFEKHWGPGRYTNAGVLHHLLRRFNARYRCWKVMCEQDPGSCFVARYEDLLRRPAAVVQQLASKFGLQRKSAPFKVARKVIRAGERLGGQQFSKVKKNAAYYLERRYLACLTEEQKRLVTGIVDWELMAFYGYTPESA